MTCPPADPTADGTVYSYRFDELLRIEQYDTVVVLYWLDGQYEFTGFTNPPDWAYEPTFDSLTASTDAVRDGIIAAIAP